MAGDPFQKVQAGERLRIPAAAYNAFVDAALHNRRERLAQGPPQDQGLPQDTVIVPARNETVGTIPQYGVLGINAPLILPTENEQNFRSRLALRGTSPTLTSHRGQFAIAQEPIGYYKIGRVCIAGITPTRLMVPDGVTTAYYAEVANTADYLQRHEYGSASILWREGGSGEQWALVRLGVRRQTTVFPIRLIQTGGSQGSESAPATWTYFVMDAITNAFLGSNVNPAQAPHYWRRPPVGQVIAATYGYAHFDDSSTLIVGWINEVPDQEAC